LFLLLYATGETRRDLLAIAKFVVGYRDVVSTSY